MLLALQFVFPRILLKYMLIEQTYHYLLFAVFVPLAFIWIPMNRRASRNSVPWYDIVLAAMTMVVCLYFVSKEHELLQLGWETGAPTVPMIAGIILWILLVEAGRRAAGLPYAAIVFFLSIKTIFFPKTSN